MPEFYKESPLKTFLTFKKWVKNVQATGYNGPHMVFES